MCYWEFLADDFFSSHQYAKYNIDGSNTITNIGRLKVKSGFILNRIAAKMNPKSETNPPKPARHQAIISPQNAIRKHTTVAIPNNSGDLGAGLLPSRKKLINPKRQITNQIVPTTRAAKRIVLT